MRIQIKGGGWYGCHLAMALKAEHEVILTEKATRLFSGASGANPARLHIGPHYPRSYATRKACRDHANEFMHTYGELTRPVPHNLYAVASADSLLDFETYRGIISADLQVLTVHNPAELGLQNVEGALQVNERHIVIDQARDYFARELEASAVVRYGVTETDPTAEVVIDCTFCSLHAVEIARFEPCVVGLLEGPTNIAVTIMDGPFPSLYPWDEGRQLSSLSSAKWTPIDRCLTWAHANCVLQQITARELQTRMAEMIGQMAHYFPAVRERKLVEMRTAIRAMPGSASDSRLCKVAMVDGAAPGPGKYLAIRAGKIDAIFEAERQVRGYLARWQGIPFIALRQGGL